MADKPTAIAGYSGKPAWAKLGIKPASLVLAVHAPTTYERTVGGLPEGARLVDASRATDADVVHVFAKQARTVERAFGQFAALLKPGGCIWISWPKKAAEPAAELDEDVVREIGLASGLVDTKVCAVDAYWSGLKFMRRTKQRSPAR